MSDMTKPVAPRCNAHHPTNVTVVPCQLHQFHAGDHQSSTGCAGSAMSWTSSADPQWLANLRQDMHGVAEKALSNSRYGGLFEDRATTMADAFVAVAAAHLWVAQERIAEAEARIGGEWYRGLAAAACAGEPEPSPKMREVSPLDVLNGDTVTVTGVARRDGNNVSIMNGGVEIGLYYRSCGSGVTVTRPAPALPDKPGTVGVATVVGCKGIGVFLTRQGNELIWVTTGGTSHPPADLADFVEGPATS